MGKEILEERLVLLHRAKNAVLKSLLSTGLLVIPEGLSWRWGDPESSFVEELVDSLILSIRQPDGIPLPVIVEGPADLLKEVRFIDFAKDVDLSVIDKQIADTEERLSSLARLQVSMVE